MRDTFLPFSKPCITEAEIAAVGDVLRSGWITTGPKGAQFESDLKAYTGAQDVVCMTSETSVMQTLVRAIGLGPGDEVITPSMTWVSMVNITALCGATPVFVDCTSDTWQIDPSKIEEKITEKTKGIIGVHLYGQPFDYAGVKAVADKHGLFVVEDCAQAVGATFEGRNVGTLGELACFSFYPGKNLYGERRT